LSSSGRSASEDSTTSAPAPHPPSTPASPPPLLGWSLYAAAVLVLTGLAARRAAPVILGEALVGAWYLGLGWATLHGLNTPTEQLLATGAVAASGAGVVLLLARRGGLITRLAGVALMLGGQALLVEQLGVDYRTSTGLLASGIVHGALAVATFVLWQRDRLSRYLDSLLEPEDEPCPTS
jgi:hypothetical protein